MLKAKLKDCETINLKAQVSYCIAMKQNKDLLMQLQNLSSQLQPSTQPKDVSVELERKNVAIQVNNYEESVPEVPASTQKNDSNSLDNYKKKIVDLTYQIKMKASEINNLKNSQQALQKNGTEANKALRDLEYANKMLVDHNFKLEHRIQMVQRNSPSTCQPGTPPEVLSPPDIEGPSNEALDHRGTILQIRKDVPWNCQDTPGVWPHVNNRYIWPTLQGK